MELIWLFDKSIKVTLAVSDKSVEPTDVMELFASDTPTSFVYWDKPVGTNANLFPLRSKVSTGEVTGVLATTVPMAVSPNP